MTVNRIIKGLLNVNGVVVEGFSLEGTETRTLVILARPARRERWRCPVCGRRCNIHDYPRAEREWRSLDFGCAKVVIRARTPRVACPEHGVHAARVPWAKPRSGFTTDFALTAAWMARSLPKSAVAAYLRTDWASVGRLIALVHAELEPDVRRRLDGLVNIGIDETSYRKGHSYITTVVNQDTNSVVWVGLGHGKETLARFFAELTPEQRASVRTVTGDGARWITDCVAESLPNAVRCVDPFHVVEWATGALDAVRLEAWREAAKRLGELKRAGAPREAVQAAAKAARTVKGAKYALGKAPENLTDTQSVRLEQIQQSDRRLMRAHLLKERLRTLLKHSDSDAAAADLDGWTASAAHSRIPQFVELERKIRRHREHILNSIRHRASNARIEAMNNKIKLLIRKSYGFRNLDTMKSMIMLFCSDIVIPLPGRPVSANKNRIETAINHP